MRRNLTLHHGVILELKDDATSHCLESANHACDQKEEGEWGGGKRCGNGVAVKEEEVD